MLGPTGLIFVGVFFVCIAIPCVGVAWLGKNMLNRLGRYPSKTPAIQLSVAFKLVIIEIVSFTLLLTFFKILVAQ